MFMYDLVLALLYYFTEIQTYVICSINRKILNTRRMEIVFTQQM